MATGNDLATVDLTYPASQPLIRNSKEKACKRTTLFAIGAVVLITFGILGGVLWASSDGNASSNTCSGCDTVVRSFYTRFTAEEQGNPGLPNVRVVSNALGRDDGRVDASRNMLLAVLGRFIQHDIDFMAQENYQSPPTFGIPIIENNDQLCTYSDPAVQPPPPPVFRCNATQPPLSIPYRPIEGKMNGTEFQIYNNATSKLDLHLVYGTSLYQTNQLRTFKDGKLRTSNFTGTSSFGKYYNFTGILPSAAETKLDYDWDLSDFLKTTILSAGDPRASLDAGLLTIHVLFLREHNRLAMKYKYMFPTWDEEKLFQQARKKNVGQYQRLAMYLLPQSLMGSSLTSNLPPYTGYNESVDSSVSVEFSSIAELAFYSGYTPAPAIDECGANKTQVPLGGPMPYAAQAVYNYDPLSVLSNAGSWENLYRSWMNVKLSPIDTLFNNEIRSRPTEAGGSDILSLTLNRGRASGVANYNQLRKTFYSSSSQDNIYGKPGCDSELEFNQSMDPIACFDYITVNNSNTGNQSLSSILQSLYGKVRNIDAAVGLLAESSVNDTSLFPRTLANIILDQWKRARDGDENWYEVPGYFDSTDMLEIVNTDIKALIKRNFNLTDTDFPVVSGSGSNAVFDAFYFDPIVIGRLNYRCNDSSGVGPI